MIKSNKIFFLFLMLLLLSIISLGLFCFFNKDDLEYQSKFINIETPSYQDKIFNNTKIHKIDIIVDEIEWNNFIRNVSLENKKGISCNIKIDDEIINNISISPKGASTLSYVLQQNNFDKYSFKIEFDKNIKNQTYYGLDSLELNNQCFDKTYMADYFIYDMMQFMDVPAPYVSFVELYVNDKFFGFYTCIESVNKSFLKRNYGNDYGNLYKPINSQVYLGNQKADFLGNDLVYTTDDFINYLNILNTAKTEINDEAKKRLIQSIKILNSNNLNKVVNIDNLVNYFVVHNFSMNGDSYFAKKSHNYYLYEKNGILDILPWDYDRILIHFTDEESLKNGVVKSIYLPVGDSSSNYTDKPLWNFFIIQEENKTAYKDSFITLINDYFFSGYFEREFNKIYSLIIESVEKDFYKNNENDNFMLNNHFELMNTLKLFFMERVSFINREINNNLNENDLKILENSTNAIIVVEETSFKKFNNLSGNFFVDIW